jgi:hypothetical protein
MLTFFKVRSTFYKLTVSITVDLDTKDAQICVSYDRRIVSIESVPLHEVRTVELATAYLKRPMGERGNLVEFLEWYHRSSAA